MQLSFPSSAFSLSCLSFLHHPVPFSFLLSVCMTYGFNRISLTCSTTECWCFLKNLLLSIFTVSEVQEPQTKPRGWPAAMYWSWLCIPAHVVFCWYFRGDLDSRLCLFRLWAYFEFVHYHIWKGRSKRALSIFQLWKCKWGCLWNLEEENGGLLCIYISNSLLAPPASIFSPAFTSAARNELTCL